MSPTTPQRDEIWTGRIESLAPDGTGIGSSKERAPDGKTVRRPIFIPLTVPGDMIKARICGRKGKYRFGETIRILEKSPHRVAPACPHFGICGGCDLLHISYEEQLRQKTRGIEHQLEKAGVPSPVPITVLASRTRHNYRHRSRIALRFAGGACVVGFRRRSSREIIPISTCMIVVPEILALIRALRESDIPAALEGLECEVLAVIGDKGKLGLLLRFDEISPQIRPATREWIEAVYAANRAIIGNVFLEEDRTIRALGQVQEHLTYEADGITFAFLPETFIQANIPTNTLLIERAMAMLVRDRDTTAMQVIDLYAGIGNLTLPIAKRVAHVLGVEGNEASVLAARANAIRNRIDNATFLHRSTERYLKDLITHTQKKNAWKKEHPMFPRADVIVVDPPRTGLSPPVQNLLARTGVERIVYISCDPLTLARDLAALAPNYVLKDIVGIDMFADISHVEIVCLLERRGAP